MADHLRAGGHDVEFIGTPSGPEARLAREAGLVFHGLAARGFDRSRPLSLIGALGLIAVSTVRALRLLGRPRADVVVGFGGYVSLPVGFAALLRRIPLVLHEQNSVPGLANRALARRATAVGVTYEASAARMGAARAIRTGNPVRADILQADRDAGRARLDLPADALVLLVFGGSRGARHVNEALVSLAPALLEREGLHVIHVAGRTEADSVRAALGRVVGDRDTTRYRVLDYLEDMGGALAASDVVVARAGATSIAEITAIGRAAILVPYPFATDDHQTLNASDVRDGGGAVVVADADLDGERFATELGSLLDDASRRERMAAASAALGVRDATERLARLITHTAEGGQRNEVSA